MKNKNHDLFNSPEVGVPFLWPFAFFVGLEGARLHILKDNIKFLEEIDKTHIKKPEPTWATRNKIILDVHTMNLRDFSSKTEGMHTLILPPYAGHTSIIADFHEGQSLVETLIAHWIERISVTEWKSVTVEMKDYDIDMYLRELNTSVDDL